MENFIESTKTDELRQALTEELITLEDIEQRFADFKLAYMDPQKVRLNPWSKPAQEFKEKMADAEESERICRDVCSSFPAHADTDPLERFVEYCKHPKVDNPGSFAGHVGLDCDASKSSHIVPRATVELYKALWGIPDHPEILISERVSEDISADTMNSFATLYGHAHNTTKRALIEGCRKPLDEGKFTQDRTEIESQFRILAYLTHTLGNFIPCYGQFNSGRYPLTKDFWDLTLFGIWEWFHSDPLPKTTNPLSRGLLEACAPWLESYQDDTVEDDENHRKKSWINFVESNYLQPYVTSREDGYRVNPFFSTLDIRIAEPTTMPKSSEELLTCLVSINAAIIARGNLMRLALQDKDRAQELWGLWFND